MGSMSDTTAAPRLAHIARATSETEIDLTLELDGDGTAHLEMPIPFLRHMLQLFAAHGGFRLDVQAQGDTDVDAHHLTEDIGLCLGRALRVALGDKSRIARYGERHVPMDETLARAVVDISGRSACVLQAQFSRDLVGDFPTELVFEFFKSVANEAKMAIHLAVLYGDNTHHQVEALFKAFGRALAEAVTVPSALHSEVGGVPLGPSVPSTKGLVEW